MIDETFDDVFQKGLHRKSKIDKAETRPRPGVILHSARFKFHWAAAGPVAVGVAVAVAALFAFFTKLATVSLGCAPLLIQ